MRHSECITDGIDTGAGKTHGLWVPHAGNRFLVSLARKRLVVEGGDDCGVNLRIRSAQASVR